MQELGKERQEIAAKVRELRRTRRWTQAELSKQLCISQSRLSELERGAGSFTAEQFLLLLRLFNVGASDFVREPGGHDVRLQNALARLGAAHLLESAEVLPSKQLEEVHAVVREALVDGAPRTVTALAPVLVRHVQVNLPKLYADLERLGLERRFLWIVENTAAALELLRRGAEGKPSPRARSDRMAELSLRLFLQAIASPGRGEAARSAPPDILDVTVRTERTLREAQSAASEISQRWGIVTSLAPEDFLQALKASRLGD